jgi:probable phosphoglycerate mutase
MGATSADFYFLRHGETDHNKHKIEDGLSDIGINANGVKQANTVKRHIQSLDVQVCFTSPLKRAIETHRIISEGWDVPVSLIEEFRECSHEIWENFSTYDKNDNPSMFSVDTKTFINTVGIGLQKILNERNPSIVIAHGGVFRAICYHLRIQKDRNISNCQLVGFYRPSVLNDPLNVEHLSHKIYEPKNSMIWDYFHLC